MVRAVVHGGPLKSPITISCEASMLFFLLVGPLFQELNESIELPNYADMAEGAKL